MHEKGVLLDWGTLLLVGRDISVRDFKLSRDNTHRSWESGVPLTQLAMIRRLSLTWLAFSSFVFRQNKYTKVKTACKNTVCENRSLRL